ncbi:MAG: UDP-glucose 4-epimerase GalE, partial [Saprospiraceae bacterium]
LELIETAKIITGRDIPYEFGPRRPGDPAILIASSEKIRQELGWEPEFPRLDQILQSAWDWHSRHPNGYAS